MARSKYDSSSEIMESQLSERIQKIGKMRDGDAMAYVGPIIGGLERLIKQEVENLKGNIRTKRSKIVFLLETTGGSVEVTERIAETLRRHYRQVEFVVSNMAMSAGTVLVMSGDSILMDYFAVLGPIDPQIEKSPGNFVPALGYLIQYERLISKSAAGKLTNAELTYLVDRFDPADLHSYEQARELSVTLLKKWLVKYKFKNWKKTKTRRIKVTRKMKEARAEWIARELQDIKRWCSHGRGIHRDVLRRNLKLEIEDFGKNADLNKEVTSYGKLLSDYMARLGHNLALNTSKRFFSLNIGHKG